MTGVLVLSVCALSSDQSYADKPFKGEQLEYLIKGATWNIDSSCGARADPVIGTARFGDDHSFSMLARCEYTYEHTPYSIGYFGKWRVSREGICIDDIQEHEKHDAPENLRVGTLVDYEKLLSQCFVIAPARIGTSWISDKKTFFNAYIEKHPAASSTEEALANAGLIVPTEPVAAAAALSEVDSDSYAWESIKFSNRVGDFQRYIEAFPDGAFVSRAEQQIRTLQSEQANSPMTAGALNGIRLGKFHALVIGAEAYKTLPRLETAVNDAKAVAEVLRLDYGFRVELLLNPTHAQLTAALDAYHETMTEEDNLLIYYAGHGWVDKATTFGCYWQPVDASPFRVSRWLSNVTITETLKSFRAKHVMIVADSCYSGTLTRDAAINVRDAAYLQEIARVRARVAMVSGGLQPVADDGDDGHSPFTRAFLEVLQNNKSIIDGPRLFGEIRRSIVSSAEQSPNYSDIENAGHDGGDFLFVRKR